MYFYKEKPSQRLESYFVVNNVSVEMRLSTLIAAMGDEAYELLSNLTSPVKPNQKTYAEVVQILRDHLQPEPSEVAERYRFRQRRQCGGEAIHNYVSELKKLTKNCGFGISLDENLRDQFAVCGRR